MLCLLCSGCTLGAHDQQSGHVYRVGDSILVTGAPPSSYQTGAAKTVTITLGAKGCLGVNGLGAVWPHTAKLKVVEGAPSVVFEGEQYEVGDVIDIGYVKSKPRSAWADVVDIPAACGDLLQPIPDGFSLAD